VIVLSSLTYGIISFFCFQILKKSIVVVVLLCVATVICDIQHFGYALPSGYASIYRSQIQPVIPIAHLIGRSQDSDYHGYQPFPNFSNQLSKHFPIYGKSYHARDPYTYKTVSQRVPITANFESINILPKQPGTPDKVAILSQKSATPTLENGSSAHEVEEDSKKGFKLLDDLVETVSQSAGTDSDSDVAEVDAVKSIFADVIDEIIHQVEVKFTENNLDATIKDAFVFRSETAKKAVAEAPNQTILAAILKPYVTHLKEFTAKGFQIAGP